MLLCVHGLTRNGRDFDTVAEGLSAHYRVVCPDMPGRGPPDLEEARSALNRIVTASHHASEVFDNLRALFGNTDQRKEPLDVNELVLGHSAFCAESWMIMALRLAPSWHPNCRLSWATGDNCRKSFLTWPATQSKQWMP